MAHAHLEFFGQSSIITHLYMPESKQAIVKYQLPDETEPQTVGIDIRYLSYLTELRSVDYQPLLLLARIKAPTIPATPVTPFDMQLHYVSEWFFNHVHSTRSVPISEYPAYPIWPDNEAQEPLAATTRWGPPADEEQRNRHTRLVQHFIGEPHQNIATDIFDPPVFHDEVLTGEIWHVQRLLAFSEDDMEKAAARCWLAYCYNLLLTGLNPDNESDAARWEHIHQLLKSPHEAHGQHYDAHSQFSEFMTVFNYSSRSFATALATQMYDHRKVFAWNGSAFTILRSTDPDNLVTPTDTTIPLTGRAEDVRHARAILGLTPNQDIRSADLSAIRAYDTADDSRITLFPAFSANQLSYNSANLSGIGGLRLEFETAHPLATAVLEGDLSVPDVRNDFTITVTSEDGIATKTYTVAILGSGTNPPTAP